MRPSRRLRPLAVAVALLAGSSLPTSPARAQVDGSPDPTFSGDGILSFGAEPFGQYTAHALAVMPNQEVVVVGDLASTAGMDHLRVSVNGNAIAECEAGILLLAEFEGLAVLVDRAGRLVVGGRSTFSGAPDQDRGLIGRFTSANSCAFDGSWSDNGWQILDSESFCDTEECAVLDVAESPTAGARIYALLASRVNSLVSRLFVVGFRANGDVDTSFGDGGYAEVAATDLGTLSSTGAQLVVDGGGRPLVFATRYDPDIALDADPFLIRFTDSGELDTTFGDDGVEIVDDISGIDGFPAGVVLGSDGTVVFAVNLDSGNGLGRASVMRPDGSPALNAGFSNRRRWRRRAGRRQAARPPRRRRRRRHGDRAPGGERVGRPRPRPHLRQRRQLRARHRPRRRQLGAGHGARALDRASVARRARRRRLRRRHVRHAPAQPLRLRRRLRDRHHLVLAALTPPLQESHMPASIRRPFATLLLVAVAAGAALATQIPPDDFRISDMGTLGPGGDFTADFVHVAYNPLDNEYLVVWAGDDDVNGNVDNEFEIFAQRIDAATGAELGANDFRISDMGDDNLFFGATVPRVVFNVAREEYLVVGRGTTTSAAWSTSRSRSSASA